MGKVNKNITVRIKSECLPTYAESSKKLLITNDLRRFFKSARDVWNKDYRKVILI